VTGVKDEYAKFMKKWQDEFIKLNIKQQNNLYGSGAL